MIYALCFMNNYFRLGFSSFCETFYKMKGNPVTASETAILHPGEFDNQSIPSLRDVRVSPWTITLTPFSPRIINMTQIVSFGKAMIDMLSRKLFGMKSFVKVF